MFRTARFILTLLVLTASTAHADPNGGNGGGLSSNPKVLASPLPR
jgi:hypothetical protein